MTTHHEFVGYTRVSTDGQRVSGLGVAAQLEALSRHVAGVRGVLLATFSETVSGARGATERAQLLAALAECRRTGATLLVARFDRLSRNVDALRAIMTADVEVVAADFPQANKMVVTILAAVAEYEREQIKARTSAALQAKVARDGHWLAPEAATARLKGVDAVGRERAAESVQGRVEAHTATIEATARMMIAEGHDTPTKLSAALTASRTLTPADWQKRRKLGSLPSSERKPWTPTAAMRLLRKLREREHG
ncbi:MAG: recombinase family protein [Stenotrophomonas sp.]|jgi:DNA invertase Pin-like site-specific DNA recombinase|uniref:recombinase family protein n=1 Tax=Stenotrophomonas sp. TaxID=69392 RepID=UPI002842E3FD|nr:recombinase family protein [Stenotrophomonas sp.]MDR2959509.1 recombinase family protein [Stenotrophomonas sp.]